MKRNMKFLLLLAIFTSSIMAAYFISGCSTTNEGDKITYQDNLNDTIVIVEEEDRVLGSIQGVVSNSYDNTLLAGVEVTWTKNDEDFSYTTNADGYYLIDDSLSSGYYVLTFSMNGYALYTQTVYIPTIADIKEDIDDDAVGWTEYMVTANIWMLPMTATVRGRVYTALPAPDGKDGEAVLALDDPNLVSVISGVTVILDYGFSIHKSVYTTTTGIDGSYEFTEVPLVMNNYDWWDAPGKDGESGMALVDWGEVDLQVIAPDSAFTGGVLYDGFIYPDISMEPAGGITTIPSIYLAIKGSGDDADVTSYPVVLAFNFDIPGFMVTDDIVISFSHEMNPATVQVDLDGADFSIAWDDAMTLRIDPALSLIPDETYDIEISGMSVTGLDLWDSEDNDFLWDRDLETQQGIRFVATNLDDYGDDNNPFKDFPLDGVIEIVFDMDVDLDNDNGWLVLYDTWNDREVNAAYEASGVTVTITPERMLKSYATYELDFRIYSNLRGDYVNDSEVKSPSLTFTTVNMAEIPDPPTGFVLDMGANWMADFNTTYFAFKWDSVSGAEYYQIFATDSSLNSDIIVVNPYIEDISFYTMQTGSVDLTDEENVSFDLYFDDDIQTPLSAGVEITFWVRAVNSAGASGFTALASGPVGDKTPPDFDVSVEGCADNTAGTEAMMFDIVVEGNKFFLSYALEYVSTIAFSFIEMGGDPAFILTSGDIAWDWDVDMRNGEGMGTVAIGACGSADYMVVSITDNSGNTGVDTMDLESYIVISEPNASTMDFEAPSFTVEWYLYDDDCGAFNVEEYFDVYFSWDAGATWTDTFPEWWEADGYGSYDESWSVYDTVFSTTAMMGLANSEGGWIWQSDVFTHTGIMVTGPDEDWLADTTIYDAEGVDSTGIPLTFDFAGLDSVGVWYREEGEGWGPWTLHDSIEVSGGTGSYTFYPPDLGYDYNCMVKVADFDENPNPRPMHVLVWEFDVINDWVSLTAPVNGEMVPGGSTPYDITWDTVWTPGTKVQLAYSVNDGTTWDTIIDSTANSGTYPWTVPATTFADNTAWLRIIDKWDLNVLDQVGPFSISGIVIDAPTAGTEWLVGTGQDIEWHSVGNVGNISMYWSNNGFTDSTLIVTNWAGGSPFPWTVPANSASANITIRLYGNTDAVYTTSGVITFAGAVVTTPISGNVAQGSSTTITWNTIGSLMGNVDIEYKYDTSGVVSNWFSLASNIPDTNSWLWNPIPAPPAAEVWVRVKNAGTPTGIGQGAAFSIAGVIVRTPNGSEIWTRGNTYDITWDVITATVGLLRIELSTNAGVDWTTLDTDVDPADETWPWTIDGAETVSVSCMIKISEMSGTITDASNAFFEID